MLVLGAGGFIGRRLVRELAARGVRVRCFVRRPEAFDVNHDRIEVHVGDLGDPAAIAAALRSCDTAYYLVHSMAEPRTFERTDRRLAQTFVAAARQTGLRSVIYVGSLGCGPQLSRHIRSRQEVGRMLRESGIPTTEFRTGMVFGRGSRVCRLFRLMVERTFGAIITMRLVKTMTQPIGLDDLVSYLLEARSRGPSASGVHEIGGADAVSYAQILETFSDALGVRQRIVPILPYSVIGFRLQMRYWGERDLLWLSPMLESIKCDTTVRDASARQRFSVVPKGLRACVAEALE